eukprot:s5430_g5.t2
MKLDLEHLQRDHIPYRRDCRACLAGSFRGHIHRRVVAPDAWCWSMDVIGPARQGEDEQLKKVKYGLIATLAVPDVLGKLLQPPEPSDEDDGGGVGPVLEAEPPWEDGGDEAEDPSAAEKARGVKEEEKWRAAVEKEQVKDVKLSDVPFFMPLTSKASGEVLAATKQILLQVRRLGLVVKRVHTDCGREFVNKGFRAVCRDRGFVRTTTGGDNFRSNGRVEALVGRAKNGVRTLLSSSSLGPEAWSFAMRHYVARVQWSVATQLGGRYPRLPPFGTKVFVKKRSWKRIKEEFTEKVVAARVLGPSLDVAKGFLVKTEDGSYLTTMVAVENVKEFSGEFEVDAPPAHADEPGVRRRLRGKTAIAQIEEEMIAKLAPLDQEHLIQDEELAAIFLEAGDYSMKAVEENDTGVSACGFLVGVIRRTTERWCSIRANYINLFLGRAIASRSPLTRLDALLTVTTLTAIFSVILAFLCHRSGLRHFSLRGEKAADVVVEAVVAVKKLRFGFWDNGQDRGRT